VQATGYNECVVVNDKRIVLGHLGPSELDSDPDAVVESVMKSGPITIRPNTSCEAILQRLQKGKMDSLLVTTADGELLGVLNRQDVEERKDHKRDEGEMRPPTTYVEVGAG
jgi:predicted transcriptional regulator